MHEQYTSQDRAFPSPRTLQGSIASFENGLIAPQAVQMSAWGPPPSPVAPKNMPCQPRLATWSTCQDDSG